MRSERRATVGHLPHTLNPRTLRRGAADAGISELARVVSRAHYPCSDETLLQYLDALDWVLDDQHIDEQERTAINELADSLGISSVRRDEAHHSYLASIIAVQPNVMESSPSPSSGSSTRSWMPWISPMWSCPM